MDATNRSLYAHFHPIAVRWGEMDALGHVNNTVFYRYSEDGRLWYFTDVLGVVPSAQSSGPILADLRCSFLQQIRFPAKVEIATRVARLGSRSFRMEQALFHRGSAEAIAAFDAVLVWFDYAGQRSAVVPEPVRARVRAMESAAPQE